MAHPHQSLLEEYQIAIQNLVPTVPKEIKEEAQNAHDALAANENATEEQIQEALVKTGRAEYPHRHAFKEMTETVTEAKRVEMVLEHVDETVRGKLKHLLDSNVALDEITKSSMFETDFTPEERYQVEDALLDAADHLKEELAESVQEKSKDYDALVKKWEGVAAKIEEQIAVLESLKNQDAKWRDEIGEKVKRFREGFSVTEQDPELVEVEKEIEYWRGTLGEEV